MPILNKVPFRRRKPDANIKDDERVWYFQPTQEVFTTYDDFFERYIRCNSMSWTCSVTGKAGLTFEEAVKSEQEASEKIRQGFPKELAQPLLWYAHKFCYRGRLDDLINDVYCVSRDRYFVGEIVWYQKKDLSRIKGIIKNVEFDPTKMLVKMNETDEEKLIPDITHDLLSRPKAVGSRVKLKYFFKNLFQLKGDKMILKQKIIQEYNLDETKHEDFFAGPLPKFAQVPRKRPFGLESSKNKKEEKNSEVLKKKKRLSKAQQAIADQQEMLKDVFEQAEHYEVEDWSKWKQIERVLRDEEIEELKEKKENLDQVSFQDCVEAICSRKFAKNGFLKVLTNFLKLRTICIDKEDGDEANPNAPTEVSNETYGIFTNKVHGQKIVAINKAYEKIRMVHAASPSTLPVDWMTISEVLRLNLTTSGYCPLGTVYARRATERGGIQCYDDPVYMYLLNDSSIVEKLETLSIYTLTTKERLILFEILREQLLTFAMFRESQEKRIQVIPELRRQVKQLRIFDAEQEKAARIAGYVNSEEEKKESKDKVVITLKSYIKSVNDGRRRLNQEEAKKYIMAGIPYDEFDVDEIRNLREHQKTLVNEKIDSLSEEIFDAFCKTGFPFLGRDRAFRSYYYFDVLKVLLIENVMDPGECDEPTPMQGVDEDNLTIERIKVTGCTGDSSNCPVHNTNRPRWMYLAKVNGIEELQDSLNPRGFREIDLADCLSAFKSWISVSVDKLGEGMKKYAKESESREGSENSVENNLKEIEHEKSESPEESNSNLSAKAPKIRKQGSKDAYKDLVDFLGIRNMDDEFKEDDYINAMKTSLLELEEKINMKALGELILKENQTRDEFRTAILESQDVRQFIVPEVDFYVHCAEELELLNEEVLKSFNSPLEFLILGFIKIIHCVRMKYLDSPFLMWPKNKSQDEEIMAAPTFIAWQKNLLECRSISALAMHYAVFNSRVNWSAIKNSDKCNGCRKRAVIEESVVCDICSAMFHMNCAPGGVASRVGYLCSASCKRKATRAKNKALRAKEHEEEEFSDDDEKRKNKDEEEDFEMDNNSSVENHEESRPTRKSTRKRMAKMTQDEDEVNYKAISMGLRNGSRVEVDVRKQLLDCQQIIEAAIKTESGYPFSAPINPKEYPDYNEVIKNPIDLRTMINKFKNLKYESPLEVWSDCKRMFKNCRIYNEKNEDASVMECADELEIFMKGRFKEVIGDAVNK
ncbi:hypothetical protein FO519_005215 [Halicephalobus sp. NKZ332]|nr:hypothetical protein FO519_005215 [Halicephalobus sp. NKZ332]